MSKENFEKFEIAFVAKSGEDFKNAQKALCPVRCSIATKYGRGNQYDNDFHTQKDVGGLFQFETYHYSSLINSLIPEYLKAITPYIVKADVLYTTSHNERFSYAFNMDNNGKWTTVLGANKNENIPLYAMSADLILKDADTPLKAKSTSAEIMGIFKGVLNVTNLNIDGDTLHCTFTPRTTLNKGELLTFLKKLTPYVKEDSALYIQHSGDYSATKFELAGRKYELNEHYNDWIEYKGHYDFVYEDGKYNGKPLFYDEEMPEMLNKELELGSEEEMELD